MMKKIFSILFIAIIVVSSPVKLLADDWTVGVGGKPERYSRSNENGPTSATILWQSGLQSVIAQQAVIEGNILVMARIQNLNDVLHGTKIVAHNLITGDTLWTKDLPVDFPSTDWRNKVSAIRDGKIYCTRAGNTNYSYLYALDAQTGNIIWKSATLINETSTEGASFTDNGDLIIGNFTSLVRINSMSGETVWTAARTSPTSDGSAAAVHGNRAYIWEASSQGPIISAFDISTGNKLFSSDAIAGGLIQQVSPFVGPDGTVFAPRTQNNITTDFLVALDDADTAFVERWRVPLGYVPFASFGVGPDGSVYSYSRDFRLIRIEPIHGAVVDSSEVIQSDFYQPRIAIDSTGIIFLTNGGFSQGRLYSFNADCSLRWSEQVNNVNVGGPALGRNGILIVCGTGTDVRAYSTQPVRVAMNETNTETFILFQNYPNPFNPVTSIQYAVNSKQFVTLKVYDNLGKEIATLVDEEKQPGTYEVDWNASGLASGIYYYQLKAGNFIKSKKMILLK